MENVKQYAGTERRKDHPVDPIVSILSTRLESLHQDVGEIKSAMNNLSAAITKLALVEERQATANAAMERAFAAIAKCEQRINDLEKADAHNKRTNKYVDSVIWSLASAALVFVAAKSGLLG
jgi:chromosome segregation ATPase